jgi:epoxide hydrolase 4
MIPADLDVQHVFTQVNGLRMHYVEKGDGPLVVLLHGFPEMWWSWRYQIPALAAAGYRVVAPDLRGYSETEAKGPYDVGTLRDDVVGLIDHLRADEAIVVAHDWGGAVAWHLASTRGDRCAKLVVMNCPHPAVFAQALFGKWSQIRRSWYMFFFQLPLLPEWVMTANGGAAVIRALRTLAIDKTHFDPEELEPMAAAACRPGRAKAMIDWYRTAIRAGVRARRSGVDLSGEYRTITAPTLLLWALEDRALGYQDVVPGTERYVANLEIQTIADCGHFVQQEQPEEVNRRLLEFLKKPA